MEKRNIQIDLEIAKKLYNSNDESLREVALQAFKEKEIENPWRLVRTVKDACLVLNMDLAKVTQLVGSLKEISLASSVIFQLNIIRRAINNDAQLTLTNGKMYYPVIKLVSIEDTNNVESIVGQCKYKNRIFNIMGGWSNHFDGHGFGYFLDHGNVGFCSPESLFGVDSKEKALYLSSYFGSCIAQAQFGDIPGFEIVNHKPLI